MSGDPFILERFPIPKLSITLGSFVLDRLEPRQSYFDPTTDSTKPKTDSSEIINPFINHVSKRSIFVNGMISRIAKWHLGGGWNDLGGLQAEIATEYTVLDSDGWFKIACNIEGVKKWIEMALWNGKSKRYVYMVTGYRTLSDATIRSFHKTNAEVEAKAEVKEASGSMSAGASAGAKKDKTKDAKMQIPKEKIYEIQYRKVRVAGFSSHSVSDAYLETGNKWIKVFTFRDGSSDEEDAIEASLEDNQDVPEGYNLVEEDGEKLFLPKDPPFITPAL
ncbi:MAG: hypothetical protein GOMPHAMPRED_000215 [Gomphillus americanus]|uniref:Uncharacterized protein n=1 Tax=Gomphillus americanus TaxID=1940652 RepID=A0A8H3EEV2_9LECA|nr:MAG: hypothetical protein GOMPHAMPRED_000215 [Gomphillus americanus]